MNHDPIFAIRDRADELRAAGKDVIGLAAGEPDTPTPDHIVESAIRAVRNPAHHRYGPAAGTAALRETAAERLTTGTAQAWTPDDILVTLGAKHALFLAFNAILRGPEETVLLAAPGWPGHRAAPPSLYGMLKLP
ncbi:aminotransferase class I/II-fold pyridoxal phosphate-dependent enzyme [Streptomyces sp. NPDC002577]